VRSIAFLAITIVSVSAKELKQSPDAAAKFVGAIGCRSSSCHGGAGEKRSQYITWSQKDFHTRAYAILLDARSARIGEAVGIPQPQSSARCTVCHSPFQSVAPSRLTSSARPDEGVSCETCHGAAEPWLRGHTRTDWTYATRVSAGLHDLRNLYVRANACVACHQNVDPDILKGGHPVLVFELDSQSINEPKHWREDDPAVGPRSWLTGQAVALREAAWRARTDPNASSDAQDTSLALAWLLSRVTATDPQLPKISELSSSDLEPLEKEADALARRATNWNPGSDAMMSILQTLAATDSEFHSSKVPTEGLFNRAVRVTLGLERLAAALNESSKIEKELNALRTDVQRNYDFDAAKFAEHLRALRVKL
jgi:hypothetical protein